MEKPVLALVADTSKNDELIRLMRLYQKELSKLKLIATWDTGQLIQGRTGLQVSLMQNASQGGIWQIGALIADGDVKAVIILRNPLSMQLYESDVAALLRICDIHNVPIATNMATAEAILCFLSEQKEMLGENIKVVELMRELSTTECH